MKKLIALVLALVCMLGLVGCQENQPENTDVLKAWSGEFSEEKLKSTINVYQSNYKNIVLEKGKTSNISFETDFEVSSCSVSLISLVDDTDIEVELHNSIYLFIKPNFDGRTVTIPINWWYEGDDRWVNDYFIWSYLVCVKDTNDSSHYYYFRVDYTAYAE